MQHTAHSLFNHAWYYHPDAFACTSLLVVHQRLLDATCKFLRQEANISIRLEAGNGSQLATHQVCDHDVRSRRANIDADNAALSGAAVYQGRTPTTPDRFSHCTFKNQGFTQELAYQQAGDATSHI